MWVDKAIDSTKLVHIIDLKREDYVVDEQCYVGHQPNHKHTQTNCIYNLTNLCQFIIRMHGWMCQYAHAKLVLYSIRTKIPLLGIGRERGMNSQTKYMELFLRRK
jgi:hypothetical protein